MKNHTGLETIFTHFTDFGGEMRMQVDKENNLYINEKKLNMMKLFL